MAGLRGETRQGQRQGRGGVRLRGRGQLAGHPADCSRRRTTGASLKTPQVGATAIIQLPVRVQRCCCRLTVSAITRDTAMAMYITPENRSEEHTSELQSLMRISYAVFCLKNKIYQHTTTQILI